MYFFHTQVWYVPIVDIAGSTLLFPEDVSGDAQTHLDVANMFFEKKTMDQAKH